ncbi:ABC transporter permease [Pseudenhygromyxa sp. WMMC2535]|uniref:ABC transporter permease subunit n=1 Tax=Pseudenhygromyxa sp. WMMC2535 TaxID=2712867 RepID=UPI001553E0B5|nr:ABC transporter permease [Pseudenhygromyxa sp. WMMC2535]NVB43372.1 ABC transporter permease [Pseudenhygromyxa sp. WMMC2535]
MSALWAIVTDTWRQSRQQIVFLIMVGVLALLALLPPLVAGPTTIEDELTGEQVEHLRLFGKEGTEDLLEGAWAAVYGQSVMFARGDEESGAIDPFSEEGQALQEEMLEIAELAENTSPLRRGVEVLVMSVSSFVFSVSMMLFIAAASGYFPSMLEAGGIDIVLAKPLERWKIYLGKYFGGLALFTVAIVGTYLLLFVGIGIRTGIWHPAVFLVMPLQILAAATLYALMALLGLYSRKANLSMILAYVYYIVVDSIVSMLIALPFDIAWLEKVKSVLRWTMPNFDRIKSAATLSVINTPAMDWQPILIAAAWIVLATGLGLWRFQRTDY